MEQKANPNRYRVWVLVQVREIGEIAQKIYELDAGNTAPTKDDTEFMVVRVDEVLGLKGEPHNLMVVIDAASEDVFKKNLGRIEEAAGGAPIAGYVVQEHYPAATYLAHGFISDEEVDEKYPPDDVNEVGRRIFKRSPGDNPWG